MLDQQRQNSQLGFSAIELLVGLTVVIGVILAMLAWTYFYKPEVYSTITETWVEGKFSTLNLVFTGLVLLGIGFGAKKLDFDPFEDDSTFLLVVLVIAAGAFTGLAATHFYFEAVEVRNVASTIAVFSVAGLVGGATMGFLSEYIVFGLTAEVIAIWAGSLALVVILLGIQLVSFLSSITF